MAPLPTVPEPELATLVANPPAGDDWLHEIKYDGYRLLCRVEGDDVRLISRNGKDWTARFRAVVDAVRALPCRRALLDGEVAILRQDGRTNFQDLQNYLGAGGRGALRYFLFDLLQLEDESWMSRPLIERKRKLAALLEDVAPQGIVQFSDHVEGNGPRFYASACGMGLEGILSKRKDSKYRPGRTRDWLKIKCLNEDDFVVGGYTEPGGAREGFGALLIGGYDAEGSLRFGGRVGTGFTDSTLKSIYRRLRSLETETSPFVDGPIGRAARDLHWVRPELVARVVYVEWTDDGVVRHPAFSGLRDDVGASEVRLPRPDVEAAGKSRSARPGQVVGHDEDDADSVAPGAAPEPAPAPEATASARRPATPAFRPAAKAKGPHALGVPISSPEKLMYPDDGITKLDVARYYEVIGEWMIRFARERPLTLVRCPGGIRDCFYQKHVEGALHASVQRIPIHEEDGEGEYAMVETAQGLVALAQLGVLEFHTWGSRWSRLETPDRFTIDLDPDPELPWIRVIEAALDVRGWIDELRLTPFVKTTGGKGLHIVVPITGENGWDEIKEFSRCVAAAVAADWPTRYTLNISKDRRRGRILLDYLRNGRGATAVEAYSTRSRSGGTVSTPIRWNELTDGVDPSSFTLRTVPDRIVNLERDPWDGYEKAGRAVTTAMKKSVGMG
ncbi:MAG: DNA ligase D [Longimicrobiales bacterium]